MDDSRQAFLFDYDPGTIRLGRDCVVELDDDLKGRGLQRALVVCGRTVGSTPAVMEPVKNGLGDRLAGVFAETTPEKYLATGVDGARRVREEDVDALVAVGGGSSLDVAKVISALTSHDDDPESVAERAAENDELRVGADGDPTPVVAVPTTLAGADLSVVGGVTLSLDPESTPHGEAPSGSVSDRRLMPASLFYDLALFETTPKSVLCASAMNGFDKAVEALYSPHATPITDGTAMRGLSLMRSGFRTLPREEMDEERLYDAVAGVVLAQYGISTPGSYKLSIVHAFGHGFSHDYDVHQGTVHGVVAPHVLEYLFDRVYGRRDLLAAALDGGGIDAGFDSTANAADEGPPAGAADEGPTADATGEELAEAVVDGVAGVRDDLGLPDRLRVIDGLDRGDLPAIAESIHEDSLLDAAPAGLEPSRSDIERVLERAW